MYSNVVTAIDKILHSYYVSTWEAHQGWEEDNWIIFLKDTGQFLYIVATLLRDIQTKKYKDMNIKMRPKNLERSRKGVVH